MPWKLWSKPDNIPEDPVKKEDHSEVEFLEKKKPEERPANLKQFQLAF